LTTPLWRQVSAGPVPSGLEEEAIAAIEGVRPMTPTSSHWRQASAVQTLEKGADGVFRPLEERPSQTIPELARAFARCIHDRPELVTADDVEAAKAYSSYAARDLAGAASTLLNVTGAQSWLISVQQASLQIRGARNAFDQVLAAANDLLRECDL